MQKPTLTQIKLQSWFPQAKETEKGFRHNLHGNWHSALPYYTIWWKSCLSWISFVSFLMHFICRMWPLIHTCCEGSGGNAVHNKYYLSVLECLLFSWFVKWDVCDRSDIRFHGWQVNVIFRTMLHHNCRGLLLFWHRSNTHRVWLTVLKLQEENILVNSKFLRVLGLAWYC